MKNWNLLDEAVYQSSWEFIFNVLHFQPYQNREKNISMPSPCNCFDISDYYDDSFSDKIYEDLENSALSWFNRIWNTNRMLALNWQHDCFSFTLDLPFEKNEFDEWLVPLFPNGDYIFYLTSDFKNGLFADGINLSLSFFGREMVQAVEIKKAKILTKRIPCARG